MVSMLYLTGKHAYTTGKHASELQISGSTKDYFSTKTYIVTPHQNRLNEMVLMLGLNICFHRKILKIIPKL